MLKKKIQKNFKKKKIEENGNETHMQLEKENEKDTCSKN